MEKTEDAKLITEILLRRRIELGVSVAPINVGGASADVVFVVRKSTDSTDVVRVLAHSNVLKKACDFFREVLTDQPDKNLLNYMEEKENVNVREMRANDNTKVGNINGTGFRNMDGHEVNVSIPRRSILTSRKLAVGLGQTGKTSRRRSKSVTFNNRLDIINIANNDGQNREFLVQEGSKIPVSSSENGTDCDNERKEGMDIERGVLNFVNLGEELSKRNNDVESTEVISTVKNGDGCTTRDTPLEEMENSGNVLIEVCNVMLPKAESPRSVEDDLEQETNAKEIDEGCKDSSEREESQGVANPGNSEENCGEIKKTDKSCCPIIATLTDESPLCVSVEKPTKENGLLVFRQAEWTESVLCGLLEWIYTGSCHVDCGDLPALYSIADTIFLSTLTWCIKMYNPVEYMKLVLKNGNHHKALLKLSVMANCSQLSHLRSMCQALSSYESRHKSFPKSFLFKSAYIHNRENDFIEEGFHTVGGCRFCILKDPNMKKQCASDLFLWEFPDHVALLKRDLQLSGTPTQKHIHYGKPCALQETLHVVVFEEDVPRACFEFFNYAVLCSFKSISRQDQHVQQAVGPEVFKLRMITRLKMGSVLEGAIRKAIPIDLSVKEVKGAGYIKASSYRNSISMVGDPVKILVAAKAIPHDMVGRSALKIRSPSLRIFCSLFRASNSMGFDLVKKSIYLIKPLDALIEILEYVTKLNEDAFEPMDTERTIVELVEPTDPF